jgi:endonuclease YncB( thermonuclease family)
MKPFVIALIFYACITHVLAHGGGLDKQGCHHNRKEGGYHCHKGPLAGQAFSSKSGVQKAIQPSFKALKGQPRIIDGDTIELAGKKIRLHGIDAPEAKQTCTKEGKEWLCGQEATWALARIIEEHWVTCQQKDVDRYKRIVAVCYMAEGQIDINGLMVEQGWALAYRKYSEDYVRHEASAKVSKAGIWVGEFVEPWEGRKK